MKVIFPTDPPPLRRCWCPWGGFFLGFFSACVGCGLRFIFLWGVCGFFFGDTPSLFQDGSGARIRFSFFCRLCTLRPFRLPSSFSASPSPLAFFFLGRLFSFFKPLTRSSLPLPSRFPRVGGGNLGFRAVFRGKEVFLDAFRLTKNGMIFFSAPPLHHIFLRFKSFLPG